MMTLTTKTIDPKDLNDTERQAFREMASWRFARYLSKDTTPIYQFIGLYQNTQPKGLYVIDLSLDDQLCEIKHRYISPNVNEKEATRLLIEHATLVAKEKYLPMMAIKYPQTPENILFSEVLDNAGWGKSRPWLIEYLFEVKLFRPKWFLKEIPLPKSLSIVRWNELTAPQINTIESTIKGGGIPHYLTPLYRQEYRREETSLYLIDQGRVVGWSCTHTYPDSTDTVRYSSLYMHPKYRFHGYAIRLLADSIRLHDTSGIKYGLFLLSLEESSRSWKRFIERNLKPYAQKITTTVRRDRFLREID